MSVLYKKLNNFIMMAILCIFFTCFVKYETSITMLFIMELITTYICCFLHNLLDIVAEVKGVSTIFLK